LSELHQITSIIHLVGAFFSYLMGNCTVAFNQEQLSSGGTQPSLSVSALNHNTLQLVGRQWWPGHCPSAPGFQLSSSRLFHIQQEALPPSPCDKLLVFLSFHACPLLIVTARLIWRGNLYSRPPEGTAMPAIPCPFSPEEGTGTLRPSSHEQHHIPPPKALLAQPELFSCTLLTTRQCMDRGLWPPPPGIAAFFPRPPSSPRTWPFEGDWALMIWLNTAFLPPWWRWSPFSSPYRQASFCIPPAPICQQGTVTPCHDATYSDLGWELFYTLTVYVPVFPFAHTACG